MRRYSLRPVEPSERGLIYAWRNDPLVRSVMGHHREVDLEIHKSWWPDALAEPTRRMMMLSCGGVPISFVSFFDIQRGISAEWGFYNAPAARGAGAEALAGWLATELGAILYAFDHLGLQELYCRTSRGNAAVLMMHERMGFAPSPAQRDGIDGMVSMTLTRGEFSSRRGSPAFDGADEIEIRPDPRDRGVLASSAAGLSPESCTRICLVASANWELAGRELRETCAQILRRPFEVNVLPPGEYPMAVSELSLAAPAQITIFAERFEDLASPVGENTLLAREGAMERLERYLDSIIEARARWGGLFLVNAFAPVRPAPAAIMESEADGFVGLAERFNSALHERLTGQDDLLIVPLPELVAEIGRRQSDPGKYWLLGRLPLGQALVDRWTSCIAGLIAAKSGRSIRLIVCDLDQTLWGGVLGEGGRAQLELGSDAPGNAYRAVQAMLKSLAGRGILLGIASRNDPAEAMEMLGDPRMVLGEADFVGHRINHLPKPANVQSLIDEIGVRPECVMVLDDNPLERAEIRAALPAVITPELPWDPADWPRYLANHPLLTQLKLLPEDRSRLKAYQRNREVNDAIVGGRSREEVLRSLRLSVAFEPLSPSTLARAVQLAAKTNQFNTSGIRYTEADLQGFSEPEGIVRIVRLRDPSGLDDIIGLCVMRLDLAASEATIQTLLLSCRALGRGIETAVLAMLSDLARDRQCRRLIGLVIETTRNQPVRDVYSKHGFQCAGDNRFVLHLAESTIRRPDWFV